MKENEKLQRLQLEKETIQNENNMLKKQAADINEECKEYKMQLDQLQNKYDELYRRTHIDTNNYRNWDANTITDWIVGLDKEYQGYEEILRMNLNQESLDGSCLAELDKNDLHRFGIKGYKHKSGILRHIKQLTGGGVDEGLNQTAFIG